jgi:hypothetical protein
MPMKKWSTIIRKFEADPGNRTIPVRQQRIHFSRCQRPRRAQQRHPAHARDCGRLVASPRGTGLAARASGAGAASTASVLHGEERHEDLIWPAGSPFPQVTRVSCRSPSASCREPVVQIVDDVCHDRADLTGDLRRVLALEAAMPGLVGDRPGRHRQEPVGHEKRAGESASVPGVRDHQRLG